MTTIKFKKGDHVYLFLDWNRKGTCAWYEWVIDSAGAKQIHLRSADGEMLKRRIYPAETGHRMTLVSETPDPEAKAIEFAQEFLAGWIAHTEQRLTTSNNPGYLRLMNEQLVELKAASPSQLQKRS